MKKLPHLLALFLFGLVLGLPFGIYVLRRGFLEKEKTMGMLGEQSMADDFAKNQFTHADPQSAREALQYAIKTHEQMRASNSKYWGNPQQIDLGWCYAELSVVEESAGNATLAKKYIEESNRLFSKRHSEAVLTLAGIDQAAWSDCAAASAATFQGRSSSMRLIGCSTMRDRTFRR